MKTANKISLTLLSVIFSGSMIACSNSNSDSQPSATPEAPKETAKETTETLVPPATGLTVKLEKITLPAEGEQKEPVSSRKYTLTEEGIETIATFKDGTSKYGNINIRSEGIEYVVNDMCATSECVDVVALITKIDAAGVKQDSYLFKIQEGQYVEICKKQDTKFEQQEEALETLTAECQQSENKTDKSTEESAQ